MNEQKALKLTIKIWDYLAKHGNVSDKEDLPRRLWWRIKWLNFNCPLCHYYRPSKEGERITRNRCGACPLPHRLEGECILYNRWRRAETNQERSMHAQEIVNACVKRLFEEATR